MLLPKVKTSSENGVKVLAVRGEFTGGDETDELRNALAAEAEGGTTGLLVDLENATYLNSTALGVLIAAHTNFSKRGATLGLCNVSKNIENLFVITKLVLVFKVYGSREDGIAALGQGG
ncbi:MAG: STAS domain-containing protein [bacterium]|nr:STAS domain-containing protein [Candidatus Kapabacteria bacterium]